MANGMLGTAVSPIVPTRNRSQAIVTLPGAGAGPPDRRAAGHLGELIATEREHLRAPQRTELADGEDPAKKKKKKKKKKMEPAPGPAYDLVRDRTSGT